MKRIRFYLILFLIFYGFSAPAAEKLDSVMIYGDNFMVSAREPDGWKSESKIDSLYNENLAFYRKNESRATAQAVIRILISEKTDENTIEDLKYDMEKYRKQYPGVQFKDLSIKHPGYKTYSKLFYVENKFYEYVTYINPGMRFQYILSVSMNVSRREASEDDMKAYSSVIESLSALK